MAQQTARRPQRRDPEYRALRRLARMTAGDVPERPLDALEQVTALARDLTRARYAALVITGKNDYVEGFVVSGLTAEEERKLKAPPQGHGPLGSMRQDGLAVRIDDLGEHATSFGVPPKHPEMKTLLGVPVWTDGAVRGALYVTDRNGGKPFRDSDEVILQVLARHATHIITTLWY
ncbi:MAG: GAF domain-containing protein [Chloroflexi bacterium]|nr:GAF domain-containing protein [Chloroflexota bacterium]